MTRMQQWIYSIAGASVFALLTTSSFAQTGADFYKGKTVTYIVSTGAGGSYDFYARLIAEYMQKYLPGSTFVVKNVPGAGHIVGTNTLYASKPDGLTIGTFNTGLIYNQVIGREGIKFDLIKMLWIGKAASEPRVFVVAAQSPIRTFADLRSQKDPVNFSTAGIGSAGYVETTMLANVLKLPIKLQTGYNGNEDQLAMRRGEIVGSVASRSSWEAFVKNGYGRFIAQMGGSQKDVPQLSSLITEPTGKTLIALIQSQGDLARLTAGPPGIPGDRLGALRDAYRKALTDKELLAKAEKGGNPVDPSYGDDVLNRVKAALNQKPEIVALLKSALEQKSAPAPATKGTIAEWDGRAKLVLKLDDGKMFEVGISGSRTDVTIAGQKSSRENIKVGMTCTVNGESGGEAQGISCN